MDPDDVLVRRAQRGESASRSSGWWRTTSSGCTLAARVLGSREDAADAVQEALVRAWLALPKFRGDARFSTWLYRIVVNAAHDVRAKRREQTLDEPPTRSTPATASPSRSCPASCSGR